VNLETLAEHTVDLDLLPLAPVVFDVGCRYFSFAGEIQRVRPLARVICFDPDPLVGQDLKAKMFEYYQTALVGSPVLQARSATTGGETPGVLKLNRYQDGVSDFIEGLACDFYQQQHQAWSGDSVNVSALTVAQAMRAAGIEHLDLVKLDCECSEFSILEDWPGPIATQLSIEFHDWADLGKWPGSYFDALFAGPLKDYRIVQHEWHGSYAHMDSLLVLKDKG
jgi:FkbM family methyltransferase